MAVVNAIRAKRSVLFTGSAGTDKSYVLKRFITMLPPQNTFITASTGAAACHIGGTTIYAFAELWRKVCHQTRVESWSECSDTTIKHKHVFSQEDLLFISVPQNVCVGR
ncbi:ATP-dependent DNA helicase PIF1 [Stylophora pistillata]|uniref:ATP-dependent DNA helicase n=1 Tax=Stylophora pistillata TaxID=50429 RepID=A0A2B4RLP5_STYPI|nr:ATP-dependent DNA helicase PIF1 [Stylophora pistillata]